MGDYLLVTPEQIAAFRACKARIEELEEAQRSFEKLYAQELAQAFDSESRVWGIAEDRLRQIDMAASFPWLGHKVDAVVLEVRAAELYVRLPDYGNKEGVVFFPESTKQHMNQCQPGDRMRGTVFRVIKEEKGQIYMHFLRKLS